MTELTRILIVDDDVGSRDVARTILRQGSFPTVADACSADQAYDMLRLDDHDAEQAPDYDMILLDVMMPQVDGIEACAAIRSSRRYRTVPIVMVSGKDDAEVLKQAFIAGANDYVGKPVRPTELLARVRSSLRFKREIDRRMAREAQLQARAEAHQPSAAAPAPIDPRTGLLAREAVEAQIGAAADDDRPAALMLLTIDGFASYQLENGAAGADRLARRVARELRALPAPLGALLGGFGAGRFIVLADGSETDALGRVAEAARTRLAQLALSHGGSTEQDTVGLSMVVAEGLGEPLRDLPARMIAHAEEAAGSGGDRIIRMVAA